MREVAHNNARTRVTRLSLPNLRKHLTTTILSHKFWHCCARLRAQQCQKLCDTIVVAKCVRELGPMFLLYLLSSLFPLMSSLYWAVPEGDQEGWGHERCLDAPIQSSLPQQVRHIIFGIVVRDFAHNNAKDYVTRLSFSTATLFTLRARHG